MTENISARDSLHRRGFLLGAVVAGASLAVGAADSAFAASAEPHGGTMRASALPGVHTVPADPRHLPAPAIGADTGKIAGGVRDGKYVGAWFVPDWYTVPYRSVGLSVPQGLSSFAQVETYYAGKLVGTTMIGVGKEAQISVEPGVAIYIYRPPTTLHETQVRVTRLDA